MSRSLPPDSTSTAPPEHTDFWSTRGIALIVATALLMQNMDSTVLATSLPAIALDLGVDPIHLKLALTSYLLSLAVFIPASGWVADRFGARRVFRWAIVVFAAGSIACAAADTLGGLIAARVLQGVGGSMMVPVGRLIVMRATPKAGLVKALAWLTVPALLGPVAGPLLGGFVTTFWHWRGIFWINIPIALLGLVLATRYIPDVRIDGVRRFDALGFFLLGGGLASALTGVSLFGLGLGATLWLTAAILAGILLLLAYVRHATRAQAPLVDLRLVRFATFRANLIGGTLFRLGSGAQPFLLPLMFQFGFGLSPFQSGLLTFASGLGAMVMKFGVQPILQRIGFRRLLTINAVLSSLFVLAPAGFTPDTHWLWMAGILFVGGLLRSLQFTSVNALAFAEIPDDRLGSATAFTSILQQLSSSVSITIAAFALEALQQWYGDSTIMLAHFPAVISLVALLCLVSSLSFARLPRVAGENLLH